MDSDVNTLLQATGGRRIDPGQGAPPFSGVSIDSRTAQAGQVFFCLRGPRFDGHDFLQEAFRKKVAGVVLSDPARLPARTENHRPFVVQVPDTLRALQDLAHHHRRSLNPRVLAITGTNGKSTTKELAAQVVATRFRTLKSEGNLNNHIGLPLNLLKLQPGDEVAVLEMGMSDRGEIARLCRIAEPDIGMITNISEAHLVHLKSVQEVQQAKGELFEALDEQATALVNADDPLVLELVRALRAHVITFGLSSPADVRGEDIRPAGLGYEFTLVAGGRRVPVRFPFPGRHNVMNAVAAAAAGRALGIETPEIARALESARLPAQRTELRHHGGLLIINDSYNANPQSMQEALRTLKEIQSPGRRFLVMGDMLELGEQEVPAHRRLGRQVAAGGIDYLVTVGPLARLAREAAREAGMPADRALAFDSREEAAAFLKREARPEDCLLFKGSRGARMEQVLDLLLRES